MAECTCDCHKTFRVGERVMARDWMGKNVGKGRVIWTQPPQFYGPYMKVRLDDGLQAIVPMHKSARLVKK